MPFKQITLGKTTITKFLTAEKVILKKTKHNRASILKKKEKKRGKKNRNHVPPAPHTGRDKSDIQKEITVTDRVYSSCS